MSVLEPSGQAPPGLQALALGRRILRQHRVVGGLTSLTRSPKGASRIRTGVLAVLQDLHAIYENMFHPDRVLMRLRKSRAIGNRRRIEHNDIGKHAFLEKAAMIQPEVRRRQCAQAPDGFA